MRTPTHRMWRIGGVLLVACGTATAHGGTLQVPAEYESIQHAIDAAVDGDTVAVSSGLYEESIDLLGKAIAVVGVDGAGLTFIDAGVAGGSAVRCVSGEGRDTVLQGFTVTGGSGTADEQAVTHGGGLLAVDASPTVMDCIFVGNAAGCGGGLEVQDGSALVIGCSFIDNFAGVRGGGLHLLGGATELVDCAFTVNVGTNGGGVACTGGAPVVSGCTFTGNSATNGCGLFTDGGTPRVTGSTFSGNFGVQGGGVQSDGGAPVIRFCTFDGNSVTGRGAGAYSNAADIVIANCRFHGNEANGLGGGLWNFNAHLTLVNCVLTGNTALLGGGMASDDNGSVLVYQCSLTSNLAFMGGGIFSAAGTVPTVLNCVLWGNFGGEIQGDATVEHTVVQGGFPGANNLDADPVFVDADGSDNVAGTPDDDLSLAPGSPAIDAGRNDLVPADLADLDDDGDTTERTPVDQALAPRFSDDPATPDTGFGTPPIVDLGAYELPGNLPGDVDGDGTVDVDDLLAVLIGWGPCPPGPCPPDLDGNGAVDVDDLLAVLLGWS